MDEIDIRFFVPALPVAQPRPRFTLAHRYAKAYTPSDHPVHAFRSEVIYECRNIYEGDALDCAFALDVDFGFPRPANKRWSKKAMPREYRLAKPDLDNLLKPIKDCLTGIVWTDDSRVVICRATKCIVEATRIDGVYKEAPIGADIRIQSLTSQYV